MPLRLGRCLGARVRLRARGRLGRGGLLARCRVVLGSRLFFVMLCRICGTIRRARLTLAQFSQHLGRLLGAHHADQSAQACDRRTAFPHQPHQGEQSVHQPLEQVVVLFSQKALRPLDHCLDRRHLDLDDLRLLPHAQSTAHSRRRKSFTSG